MLDYFVDHLFLPEDNCEFEIDYGGSRRIVVIFKPIISEILAKNPQIKGSSCCAKGSYKPSEKIINLFDTLQKNKFPGDENLIDLIRNNEGNTLPPCIIEKYEESYQKVENIPLSYFPKLFQSFIRQVRSELHNYIEKTIDVFRWRFSRY